jgi:hypothetical protein
LGKKLPKPRILPWSFAISAGTTTGTCSVLLEVTGYEPDAKSIAGTAPQPPLTRADFVDLYPSSCLNGWTMGNIAVSPRDVARFYHLLGTGKLVSADSLAQMRDYKPLTVGFAKGTGYGLGLIDFHKTQKDVDGRVVNWTQAFGHVGEDWGSSISKLGYYPNLKASMALATNAVSPMNFTEAGGKTKRGRVDGIFCAMENAVFQYLHPDQPALQCT